MATKPTAADTPDAADDRDATVFVRIPEPLHDAARQAKYDLPLAENLASLGVEHSIRGFLLPGTPSHPAGVGIEVRVAGIEGLVSVVRCLADLGPPESLVEYDTAAASMQTSLARVLGK